MLTPTQQAGQAARVERLTELYKERQQWTAAGIAWPPVPYQRVEVAGNLYPHDPAGPLLGTVLHRNGSYTDVLLDFNGKVRNCYWDNELRPVLTDPHPGWVPYDKWKDFIAPTADRTLNYDLKTAEGSWCFGCYPKPQVTGDYQFQQVVMPHARYSPAQIVGIRLSEY